MKQAKFLGFSIEEYKQGLHELRDLTEKERLDVVLLPMRDNLEHLSDYKIVSCRFPDRRSWLVIPLQGDPVLMVDTIHDYNT